MGYSTVRRIMREGLTDPRNLDGIALWNSTRDVTDLTTDTGIKLWADKSGNSSTNVLCLNGVAGNYASAPDSVPLSITGDIDIRAYVAAAAWTTATQSLADKLGAAGQRSYVLRMNSGGNGYLELVTSADGTAVVSATSGVIVPFANLSGGWVRATLDVNDGSGNRVYKFWTSTDGPGTTSPTWTQLGSTTTTAGTTSIFDGTRILTIGADSAGTASLFSGNVFRVQIRSNILDDGTGIVFDANFTGAAKLAPSFTESSSNAATVTINTSGATGARISGARDLYQGTAANQPILTIAAAGNYLTFDGSNDNLKAAAFGLAQPETVYFVGSQVTWAADRYFYDGGTTDRMALIQRTTTPTLRIYASGGGSYGGAQNGMAVATNAVSTAVYSGAASAHRINRAAAVAGPSVGTDAGNGFTLGSAATPAAYGNITAQEVVVYSTAQDENYQYRVTRLLSRRTGVLVV